MTKKSELLELYHTHGTENRAEGLSNGNEPPNLGVSHLGFTVLDIAATVERLRGASVRILKEVGVCERERATFGVGG
jgi:lactoylglutathione lyase